MMQTFSASLKHCFLQFAKNMVFSADKHSASKHHCLLVSKKQNKLKGFVKEPNILIYLFFPPITQW